jgi:heme oxygenase
MMMLERLKRDTRAHHHAADADRQSLIQSTTPKSYRRHLSRIYGFEAPAEAAFARTRGLGELIDLAARTHVRRLGADLTALGIPDLSELPQCPSMLSPSTIADALGWMYVVEHNALLHGELHRKLENQFPSELAIAGRYLTPGDADMRLAALGTALDVYASSLEIARQIVEAAKTAFRRQRAWYATAVPLLPTPNPWLSPG